MLRKVILFLLLLISIFKLSFSKDKIQFNFMGYGEIFGGYRWLNLDSLVNPNNIYNVNFLYGEGRLDLNVKSEWKNVSVNVESFANYINDQEKIIKNRLYQGYVSISNTQKSFLLRLGKTRLGWGTGTIWNPIRTFERKKDLIYPENAVEGEYIGEAQFFFKQGNISFLILPPIDEQNYCGFASRFSYRFQNLDSSISVYKNTNNEFRAGFEASLVVNRWAFIAECVYLNFSSRNIINQNLQYIERGKGNYFSYVTGFTTSLPWKMNIIFEYFHDGEAFGKKEFINFRDSLPQTGSLYNPFGNGKDSIFIGISRGFDWLNTSISFNSFYNFLSSSQLHQIRFEFQFPNNLRTNLLLLLFNESSKEKTINMFKHSIQFIIRYAF